MTLALDQRTPAPAMTLSRLADKYRQGEALVMVTAYDFPSAEIVEEAGVDLVLAGDTAAEVVLGYRGTTQVSFEEMLMLTSAVRRGLRTPLLVGDLPFASYEASNELAVRSSQRLIRDAGADVVKLERGGASAERARAITGSGIAVMGHVGLTPQSEAALGGRRARGRTAEQALALLREAQQLERAGCFAVVLEAVPAPVAAEVTKRLTVPTIGIGAGPKTSGQVLVWHDLMGMYEWRPRFAKAFAELRPLMVAAVGAYAAEVRGRRFPAGEHCYEISDPELTAFRRALGGIEAE